MAMTEAAAIRTDLGEEKRSDLILLKNPCLEAGEKELDGGTKDPSE